MAVTISGAISGRATSASPIVLPGKAGPRSKAIAAGRAISVEAAVATHATSRLFIAARRRSSLAKAVPNHRRLKPLQMSAIRLALKA